MTNFRDSVFDSSVLEMMRQREEATWMSNYFSEDELMRALESARNGKATGDNGIPYEYYKAIKGDRILFTSFLVEINKIWKDVGNGEGTLPTSWTSNNLKILFKKGDRHDLNKYRGITLMDTAAKLMTSMLTQRFGKLLEVEGLEEQCGFMRGRGCSDGSFSLKAALQKRREHNLHSYVVFVDLVKAFDSVPRQGLFAVLNKFGVPVSVVTFLREFHKDLKIKIKLGGGRGRNRIDYGGQTGRSIIACPFSVLHTSGIGDDERGLALGQARISDL